MISADSEIVKYVKKQNDRKTIAQPIPVFGADGLSRALSLPASEAAGARGWMEKFRRGIPGNTYFPTTSARWIRQQEHTSYFQQVEELRSFMSRCDGLLILISALTVVVLRLL